MAVYEEHTVVDKCGNPKRIKKLKSEDSCGGEEEYACESEPWRIFMRMWGHYKSLDFYDVKVKCVSLSVYDVRSFKTKGWQTMLWSIDRSPPNARNFASKSPLITNSSRKMDCLASKLAHTHLTPSAPRRNQLSKIANLAIKFGRVYATKKWSEVRSSIFPLVFYTNSHIRTMCL